MQVTMGVRFARIKSGAFGSERATCGTGGLMIEKVFALKNVGKFRDYSAKGDVAFRRLTLIFAPNGRGKTTFCDVLRSLHTGRAEYMQARTTLGIDGAAAEASLRIANATVSFKGGAWSTVISDFAIFDSTFIHDNVYAGDYVDRDHKRGLHDVIVGTHGVVLARAVESIDSQIKVQTKSISDCEKRIQPSLVSGIDLKTFVALTNVTDVDTQIEAAQVEVDAASRASEVAGKGELGKISCPALPDDFEPLLDRELGELSKDTEKRVRDHIDGHTKKATERWLADGLDFVKSGECPFCESLLPNADLVGAYRSYFGESYKALKADIATMIAAVGVRFGEQVLLEIQRITTENASLETFWSQFITVDGAALDFNDVRAPLARLRDVAQRHLSAKQQTPLEAIEIDADLRSAVVALAATSERFSEYNQRAQRLNEAIQKRKGEIKKTDLLSSRKQLVTLQATKIRMKPEVASVCEEYSAASITKKALEAQKKDAKAKLDDYGENIFAKYQSQINSLLEKFGADFRIANTTRSYAGGPASSNYQLVINSVPVDLGGPDAPLQDTGFRNTLSSGDRSTLALAFFIAQLELDPELAKKIVIFDDPFTSQDRSRRAVTQRLIQRKSTGAAQVVVFSHDAEFLKLLCEGYDVANIKMLQLARVGDSSIFKEWDMEAEIRPAYDADRITLTRFVEASEGDRQAVVRCIRPVLEGYLRMRAKPDFKAHEWLGDFIKNVRAAPIDAALAAFLPSLAELEDINEFSKKHHHQDDPLADSEPIDDGELLAFAKRTLAFVAS